MSVFGVHFSVSLCGSSAQCQARCSLCRCLSHVAPPAPCPVLGGGKTVAGEHPSRIGLGSKEQTRPQAACGAWVRLGSAGGEIKGLYQTRGVGGFVGRGAELPRGAGSGVQDLSQPGVCLCKLGKEEIADECNLVQKRGGVPGGQGW